MFQLKFIAPITVAAALTSFNPLASAALPTYDAIAIDFNLSCSFFKLSEAGDGLGSCGGSPAVRRATGELIKIPRLPGYSACTVTDMNRVGKLVGQCFGQTDEASRHASFSWTQAGGLVPLATYPTDAEFLYPPLISDQGSVSTAFATFTWSTAVFFNAQGRPRADPNYKSRRGNSVPWAVDDVGNAHGARDYLPGTWVQRTGRFKPLPLPTGATYGRVSAAGRDGKRLVGTSNSGAVYWTNGGRRVLPTVALSDYTEFLGISDSGLAMGYYQTNQGDTTPFVWSPTGEWADVSTRIAPESPYFGVIPNGCHDMNAVGQLICEAIFNGAVRQLLMTPR